jgi:hypothetical protein
MFNDSCFSAEVTDFRKLSNGRRRRRVVVVDLDHRILFITRVFQNRPITTGKIRFDNSKSFDLNSRTVENQRVSLFICSEELERRWLWQCEIEKVGRWMESARPEDVIVFADFVAEESGRPKINHYPPLVFLAKLDIRKGLRELGLVQLQRLTAILYPAGERTAALEKV